MDPLYFIVYVQKTIFTNFNGPGTIDPYRLEFYFTKIIKKMLNKIYKYR